MSPPTPARGLLGLSIRRRLAAVALLACCVSTMAGCAATAPSPGGAARAGQRPTAPHGIGVASVSTTTTLAQCGFVRDPFDPTNSPPPAGLCP